MKTIYLDNNATSAVDPLVFKHIKPYFCEEYGNPSSIHTFGGKISSQIDSARKKLASLLGAHPSEIIFTGGGTESDNSAIFSALHLCPKKNKVVISKVEHPAVLNLGKELTRRGYKVYYAPVTAKGDIDMERLEELIDDETAVVSLMWGNNETGNIHPVEEIARTAKKHGAVFHTDAVQAVGKIPINLSDSEIDMLSLSGHKLHAPKGIGALYVRRGMRYRPYMIGGHQERGRRAGTENVPGIVGLGVAAELAEENMELENTYVRDLRDKLENGLMNSIPSTRINGNPKNRLPNTSNISFEYIEGESILMLLDREGICASSGSACTTGNLEPSHVLKSMGVPYTAAHGAIRFSLSRFNTEEEIEKVIKVMPSIIEKLRKISPYWNS